MGIVRLNQLPDGSGNLTNDDIFLFMDDPSGSGITKKISLSEIASAVGGGGGNPFDWTLILNSDNTISAYNLTSIGDNQFSGNTGIGLRIGSVTSIGSYAFRYCSGLSGNLTIPNSVTSIGNYAFDGCSGFSGNLNIPNSVTSIGNGAFTFCGNFSGNLTIPDSVTTFGSAAFGACAGFDGNLTIGNSVTTIGSAAFAYCSGFDGNLTIGNSVTTIGSYAFYNCSGLTNVNCYAPSTVFPNSNELSGCTFSTFHVLSSDNSWTAGSTTLGGHTFTVIKDLV